MQTRTTGLLVLGVFLAALLYLWQPWSTTSQPTLNLGLDLKGGLRVVLQADQDDPLLEDLNSARRIIENRIDAFGVAEPLVQTSGSHRIAVELPGLSPDDQERALDLIGQQAVLEFRIVSPAAQELSSAEITEAHLEPAAFTGEVLQTAQATFSQPGTGTIGAVVTFEIRSDSAAAFGEFTASNIGRRMAIVLDGNVISAPVIQSRIGSSGQITGLANIDEASDLALVLRSGSLPISLHVEEIRAIGPTLGADSVRAGMIAGGAGGLAILVFVLLYYGPIFGGMIALGVAYAMLVILGVLAGLGATLTLPGLAGLILTIGSALDGNVISFERIKEELRAGKGLQLAMRSGFQSSLPAIIDANATTLIAAAALYEFTSGPVRGFATTLAIGIVASVFANTVVVPFLLRLLLGNRGKSYRTLMPKGFYAAGIPFIPRAPLFLAISGVLVVGSLALLFTKGLPMSMDFTGGTSVLLSVPEGTTLEGARAAVASMEYEGLGGGDAVVQHVGDLSERLLSVRVGLTGSEAGVAFASVLGTVLEAEVMQTEFVGPAVGEDLRVGAWWAMAVAFGLILAYVAWRFRPNWIVAVAAIVGSIHDVVIVLGILSLTGAEFSITVLAALLFIVGYSLNDSVIIADRIRENLRKDRGRDYAEIVNTAINQTLSRTVVTSTTIFPVIALLLFGGSTLRDFSLALLVGIAFGTYSSIFLLGPTVVWFRRSRSATLQAAAAKVAHQ